MTKARLNLLFLASAISLNSFAQQTRIEQQNACAQAEAQEQAQAGLPKTPIADYIIPLLNTTFGSAWCKCRDIGTSPHIGQDYYDKKIPNYSLASSNGTVKNVRFIADCGYEVMFEDSDGAVWRYLHLEKPTYAVGQKLWRGEIIGRHQKYPSASCGSGPHLHLERRVAGAHPGKYTQETCQKGRKDCFYDPVTLFRDKQNVRTETERKQIVSASQNATGIQTPHISTDCLACSTVQPAAVELSSEAIGEIGDGNARLVQTALMVPARKSRDLVDWSAKLTVNGIANPGNLCTGLLDCVTHIEFHVQTKTGDWKRLFADSSVRNSPLGLPAASAYCWPEDSTGNYRVVAWTLKGRKIVELGQVKN